MAETFSKTDENIDIKVQKLHAAPTFWVKIASLYNCCIAASCCYKDGQQMGDTFHSGKYEGSESQKQYFNYFQIISSKMGLKTIFIYIVVVLTLTFFTF